MKKGREALDDRELVERILDGENDLFAEIVRRYERRIVNYVYRIIRRYEDAHDLTQEIFTKVYLALDRYDPSFQFSTWIFRIAQNASIDVVRRKPLPEISLTRHTPGESEGKEREFADEGVSPYRDLRNRQLADAIETAVGELPDDYRELIQLRHFGELSYDEIATLKKLPLGTVKNKLFRARNLLKEKLDHFVEPA